jgi:hypothetical protein
MELARLSRSDSGSRHNCCLFTVNRGVVMPRGSIIPAIFAIVVRFWNFKFNGTGGRFRPVRRGSGSLARPMGRLNPG